MANFDQPIMWQLEEMIAFCQKHRELYIYGAEHNQQMLKKYLNICGIEESGFVVSKEQKFSLKKNIYRLSDIVNEDKKNIGFLLALSDFYFNLVLKELLEAGYTMDNIYILSEYNKRTISHKMTPRKKENMMLEVNLADHCNLNCQMCDHFSPLAKPTFLNLDSFKKDMKRLKELTDGYIGLIKLEGGEPLLNDQVIEFIKVTRNFFPKTTIYLITNGLLLKYWENHPKGNLWKVCHDFNVRIELTIYPISIDLEGIKRMAERYHVQLDCFSEIGNRGLQKEKQSVKHPLDLTGNVEIWQFVSCYQFNECIALRDGKLYTCPIIPYSNYFNQYFNQNLKVSEDDYIDIYLTKNYEELADFVSRRTKFCNYCRVRERRSCEWKQSQHTLSEYIDEKEYDIYLT